MSVPNLLSISRILLTPVIVVLFYTDDLNNYLIATFLFFLASATDWYDGYYARKYNLISKWGQFLDPLADKVLVITMLIVFWFKGYVFGWIVWSIIIRDSLITIFRALAIRLEMPIKTSALAKFKTFLQLTAIFWLLIYLNAKGFIYIASYTDFAGILFLLVGLVTIASGLHYFYLNKQLISSLFKNN
jgi:CDP-diacylglycerol--glycerol-3-phosphate 3-phosphatidyltransferase